MIEPTPIFDETLRDAVRQAVKPVECDHNEPVTPFERDKG